MDKIGQNLAFIVGHYKAGSTWLLRLLSLHPHVRGVAETHIFHHVQNSPTLAACTEMLFEGVPWSVGGFRNLPLHRVRQVVATVRGRAAGQGSVAKRPATLLDLGWVDGRALRRELANCRSQSEYCRFFFSRLHALLQPSRYLLEKTPRNIRYVPFIRDVFPAAKLLAIYRDGRDVCTSDRFFKARRGEPWSLEESVNRWRADMEMQRRFHADFGLHAISYESLQTDPKTTVANLLGFLELDRDAHLVERLVQEASFERTTGRKPGAEDRSSFNRKGIVGDWRNHFTPGDRETFKQLANDLLVDLNYERDANW